VALQIEDVRESSAASASRDDRPAHPSGRRADIQGLRALAVLLVVAYHAGLPLTGGFIGVDMFFVISGFVIAGMLVGQLERTGEMRFAAFYTRRMRRLLPALALLTVFVAIASVFLLSPLGPQQATAKTGIAASLFSANLQLMRAGGAGYFDLATETNALLHTWSLSVEEQFYFVFPAFLIAAWRFAPRLRTRRSPRRTTATLVLLATAASFALCAVTTSNPTFGLDAQFAFYSPLTRAWEFGVGVLLALGSSALLRVSPRVAGALGIAGAVLVGIGAVTFTGATPFPGSAALVPVAGTALLIVAGTTSHRGVTALLGTRPAVWVGDVSYGWYLWHWPLIVFAAALWPANRWAVVVVAAASLAPTWLSYRFVENPIRFDERLVGRRIVPLVALCVLAPIAAYAGLFVTNRLVTRSDAVDAFSEANQLHADHLRGCDNATPIGERTNPACTWPVEGARGTVYLVGDSNAGQLTEPMAEAANQAGYDLTVATNPSCPFVDLVAVEPAKRDGVACHRFVTGSVDALTERSPDLVIIAVASVDYLTKVEGSWELHDPRTGEVAATSERQAAMWEDGLVSVLDELAAAGIPTLVVDTVPHPGQFATDWLPQECAAIRFYDRTCGRFSIDRAQVDGWQRPAREAQDRAVERVAGSASADFTDDLCSPEACTSERNGTILYRDGDHLSVDGARTLTDHARELILEHVARP
jgi:peptidoglycan/LPS O-acetylase OafA/YrhL